MNKYYLNGIAVVTIILSIGMLLVCLLYSLESPEMLISALAYAVILTFFVMLYPRILNLSPIPKKVLAVAHLFGAFSLLAIALLLIGYVEDFTGARCSGFFGVKTDCIDRTYFILTALYGIPYTTLPALVLALTGIHWLKRSAKTK